MEALYLKSREMPHKQIWVQIFWNEAGQSASRGNYPGMIAHYTVVNELT